MSREAELFGVDQLSSLVGDTAASYRNFGCIAAAATSYRSDSVPDAAIRIEIFDMGSQLNAFGYLADQISTLEDPALAEAPGVLEIREAGIIGTGRLVFFKDRFLVQLQYQDLSPDASEETLDSGSREHLPPIARHLARQIPGEVGLPEALDGLPRRRRVRRSERYYPEHLMGLPWLGAGISALYGDPGPRYLVGILLDLDGEANLRAYETTTSRLEQVEPIPDLGSAAARGRLGDDTIIIAVDEATVTVALLRANLAAPRMSHVVDSLDSVLNPRPEDTRPSDPRPWRRESRGASSPPSVPTSQNKAHEGSTQSRKRGI